MTRTVSVATWTAFAGALVLFTVAHRQRLKLDELNRQIEAQLDRESQAVHWERVRSTLEVWTVLHGCVCEHRTERTISVEQDVSNRADDYAHRAAWALVNYAERYPSAENALDPDWNEFLVAHLPDDGTNVMSRAKTYLRRARDAQPPSAD